MADGWIKLWRKLRDNPYLNDVVQRSIFVTLLLDAEHEPRDRRHSKGIVRVVRGQAVTSTRALAAELTIGHQQVRRALDNLRRGRLINTQTNTAFTIVTICNFDRYQGSAATTQHSNQHTNQHTPNTPPTQLQEGEEGEEGKKEQFYMPRSGPLMPPAESGGPKKKGSRLPPDWTPNPKQVQYALDHGLDPRRTAIDFKSHWLAKAGKDALKADWNLTWGTWCRNAADYAAKRMRVGNGTGQRQEGYVQRLTRKYGIEGAPWQGEQTASDDPGFSGPLIEGRSKSW